MNVFDCWEQQREELKLTLRDKRDMADVQYAVRHALSQTEQNAMAEQTDDVLRQQMGVLFGMLKNAVGLLDTPVSSTAWVAQSRKQKEGGRLSMAALSALLTAVCGLVCYFKGILLGWVCALAALVTGGIALVVQRKQRVQTAQGHEEVKVTLSPDVDKLLASLDMQLRAIDRCANDFAYLNEGLRERHQGAGAAMVERVSALLEALYECDPDTRSPAEDAVRDMLTDMGLKAVNYTEENRGLFTALPSKNETRTLAPAIVSAQDARLLKRGTAAVRTDAA